MNDITAFKPLSELTYLHGSPAASGKIRAQPDDFYVQESLSFEPSGEGEHLFLWVEKRESNTDWVAKQLAKHYGVRAGHVGWAGLKDRNAVTRQWFGIHLPGLQEVGEYPESAGFKVLKHTFNNRKLRVGAISSNLFRLRVTELDCDADMLEQRLELIKQQGVPNYFGEQRFGRGGNNLNLANDLLLKGKRLKKSDHSMALSAARSYVFNQMLSARIDQGIFTKVRLGDVLMLDKTKSVFAAQAEELTELQQRMDDLDCHCSCPMPGSGKPMAEADALTWECEQLERYADWLQGLDRLRVSASRRAGRLLVQDFSWSFTDETELLLEFSLPTGAYATSVLRELLLRY